MAKIYKFPSKDELLKREMWKEYEQESERLNNQSDECIASSHFILDIIEELINTGEVSNDFIDMNFRDETIQESRDMFVIVNILNAMFNRYYGIPHALHREMDRIYTKIKLLSTQHEESKIDLQRERDTEYEIIFEPDFDMEDPDDTD